MDVNVSEVIACAQEQLGSGNNQIRYTTASDLISIAHRAIELEQELHYYRQQLVDLGYLHWK